MTDVAETLVVINPVNEAALDGPSFDTLWRRFETCEATQPLSKPRPTRRTMRPRARTGGWATIATAAVGVLVVFLVIGTSGGGPTIVCAQLGNVNTGAFDPLPAIAEAATEAGVWLHVDGAFGM